MNNSLISDIRISGTALQGPCIHLPTSTATPTPIADESMADQFKVENPWPTSTIPWRMAYVRISLASQPYFSACACALWRGEGEGKETLP